MNRGGKMDNQIFTLKNVLLHLTRLTGLDVKEKSLNSNHDISRGQTAAKKKEVIFYVNIIIRAAPKEGLPGYITPPPPKKSKFKKKLFYRHDIKHFTPFNLQPLYATEIG
jgi:hypothetical protein